MHALVWIFPLLMATEKGTLPEVSVKGSSASEAEARALAAEVLISKTENQAIQSLQAILKKRKGSPDEPQLWFRLAELYLRRAKTGRFFDLHRDSDKAASFVPQEIRESSARKYLQQGIDIYHQIEKNFPGFVAMDEVLFNNAFAHQSLIKKPEAEILYSRLVQRFPRSFLIPDARLALGEIAFDAQRFEVALEHFKEIEKYPESRVYSYGLYKSAWTLYNQRKNSEAIEKLISVVELHDPRKTKPEGARLNYNLRSEALRDLGIFFADLHPAEKAVDFFARLSTNEELGEALILLGKLYNSHSRHKEANTFLSQFISEYPLHPAHAKSRLLLVEANESLRQRPEVLKQLKALDELCSPSSKYRQTNAVQVNESCDIEVRSSTLEMARKWWEIWLKNRNHKEFAQLTRDVFEIYLRRDPPQSPDTRARHAFAELLFQLQDYRKASAQYEIVRQFSQDSQLQHDSAYSALVSLEKAIESQKLKTDDAEILRLSEIYLETQPKGKWVEPVRLKVALTQYQNQNIAKAEGLARSLAKSATDSDIRHKAQDLLLEVLNQKKSYRALKEFAQEFLQDPKALEGRRLKLSQITQEADLAEIQQNSQGQDPEQSSVAFAAFAQRHPQSKLAKEALWQALSLLYSAGLNVRGSQLSMEYAQKFPQDKRSEEAVNQAAAHFMAAGLFEEALRSHLWLAERHSGSSKTQHLQAAFELSRLNHDWKKARALAQQLLEVPSSKISWVQIYELEKQIGDSLEINRLEKKILNEEIEPSAGEIRLRALKSSLEQKNWKLAFDQAKEIMGSKAPTSLKAQARLAHAQIFEQELFAQGLRTSIDRLPTVLALKTEKLDRAQTAYLQTAKMSPDPDLQIKAFEGLLRAYSHYVQSISALQIKGELAPEEEKILHQELHKLIAPIAEKKTDVEVKWRELSKSRASGKNSWAHIGPEDSLAPQISPLEAHQLPLLFPIELDNSQIVLGSLPSASRSKCPAWDSNSSHESKIKRINQCWSLGKMKEVDASLLRWSEEAGASSVPILYYALRAFQKKQFPKSLALMELALERDPKQTALLYPRALARMHSSEKAPTQEIARDLAQLDRRRVQSDYIQLWNFEQAWIQQSCSELTRLGKDLDSRILREGQRHLLLAECWAQLGEFETALRSLRNSSTPEEYLQLARIHERFRAHFPEARLAYENALRLTPDAGLRSWIQRKLQYLDTSSPLSKEAKSQPERMAQ